MTISQRYTATRTQRIKSDIAYFFRFTLPEVLSGAALFFAIYIFLPLLLAILP